MIFAASDSPLELPRGYAVRKIGTTSTTCTSDFRGTNCSSNGDLRLTSFGVGNLADNRGFMYGITQSRVNNIPVNEQELFTVSPEGSVETVAKFNIISTCAVSQSGAQATFSNRSIGLVGYNLAASALFLSVQDQSVTYVLLNNTQDGFFYRCENGTAFLSGTDGSKVPIQQSTSTALRTIVRVSRPGQDH